MVFPSRAFVSVDLTLNCLQGVEAIGIIFECSFRQPDEAYQVTTVCAQELTFILGNCISYYHECESVR